MSVEPSVGSVLLLDPLELRRESIRSLLEPWSSALSLHLEVMAPEGFSESSVQQKSVRLAILNVGGSTLNDPDQQDAMARMKQFLPNIPCVVLSDRRDPEEAISAATAGMQAFLSTAMQPAIVNQVLAFVLAGGTYFPREALLVSRTGAGYAGGGTTPTGAVANAGLTARQGEVLERLRFGKSNKHIARELHMQEATVKVHVRQIMRKLGAANRTQVALLAQTSARANQSVTQSEDEAHALPLAAIPSPPLSNTVAFGRG